MGRPRRFAAAALSVVGLSLTLGAVDRDDPKISILFEETFDNRPEGQAIYTEGNYNLHVRRDPLDPKNLMCWSGPYEHKTRGFGPGFQLPNPDLSLKDGVFVVETRFLFDFDASYWYRLSLMCKDNSGFIIWDVNANNLFGFKPERNKWYTLRRGIKIRENKTSLLVYDDTGKILYRELDRPIEDPNLHLALGIKSAHSYIEPDLRVHDGFMAYDDLVVYTTTPAHFDAQIARDIAASATNTRYFETLAARAEKAPPAANAAARAKAFATRNTGAQAEAVCRDLVAMLDLAHPAYAGVKAAHEKGDSQAALRAFRTAFFAQLRTLDEAFFDTSFRFRELHAAATTKIVDLKADALLHDLIPKSSTTFVACGRPGVINWTHDTVQKKFDGSFFFAQPYLWTYKTFDPLWRAYLATGDARYIRKWHEILDDYCLNQTMPFDLNAADLPDSMSDSAAVRDFLYVLKLIAAKLPADATPVNEVSLARLVAKLVTYYPANLIVYMRSNPQNWSNGEYTDLALTGLALSKLGFRAGEAIYRAGRQKMELYSTQANTLDGSDAEQVVAYDIVYSDGLNNFTRGLKRVAPERLSRTDEDFITDNAVLRATFLMHFITPGGNYPMGFQSHLGSRIPEQDKFRAFIPQAFDQYQNRELTQLLRRQNGFDHEQGEVPPPTFTSEAFPYGGYYFFRDGWSKTGQNGFLYGHSNHVISNMGKNVFVLNAFGQDLLVAGNVGMYDHCVTQNFVDGKRQDFNAGVPYWGHRGPMIHANQEPLDARWGSSDLFDFGETFYSGAYLDGITDVTHQRMVAFLKEQGVWIVTDRQTSPRAHTYTTRWTLPIEPTYGNGYAAFRSENIHADAATQTVRTQEPGKVNLSIYNFARGNVSYRFGGRAVPEGGGERISDFRFVDTDLAGAPGDNILVSVFVPRRTCAAEASDVRRLDLGEGVVGCALTPPQGGTVLYAVAADRKRTFTLDGVTVMGEALVLSTRAGRTTGLVLGASALAVDGRACPLPRADFQFVREGTKVSVLLPIAKPIARVEVSPEATVFTGETEIVLTCATPDVEIRYTTDLAIPTLASQLYTGPIKVSADTVIKARAFRKGLTATPVVQSGTEMSAVTRADLTRAALHPAVDVPADALKPGLAYQFFAGEWEKAFYGFDGLAVRSAGVADVLFGAEPVRNSDGTYAVRYAGYFVAPADGVYTFWAPEEYISQNIVAGYELRVTVDGTAWQPTARRFARGAWSIPLAKGAHAFQVDYVDFRADSVAWYNREGMRPIVWPGRAPTLELSGPNLPRQTLPASLLRR